MTSFDSGSALGTRRYGIQDFSLDIIVLFVSKSVSCHLRGKPYNFRKALPRSNGKSGEWSPILSLPSSKSTVESTPFPRRIRAESRAHTTRRTRGISLLERLIRWEIRDQRSSIWSWSDLIMMIIWSAESWCAILPSCIVKHCIGRWFGKGRVWTPIQYPLQARFRPRDRLFVSVVVDNSRSRYSCTFPYTIYYAHSKFGLSFPKKDSITDVSEYQIVFCLLSGKVSWVHIALMRLSRFDSTRLAEWFSPCI